MGTTWLPNPSRFGGPASIDGIKRAYATLMFLEVHMWAISYDKMSLRGGGGQRGDKPQVGTQP